MNAPCIIWEGGCSGSGYGQLPSQHYAHRVAFELTYGPVPAGHEIHHLCENKLCVNPAHLRALTRAEHMRLHAGDHCKFGHPFEARGDGRGRECKVCHRLRQKENQKRRNAQQRERRRKARVAA